MFEGGEEMREIIKQLKKDNIRFYTDLILELGLLRKRNECAICFKQISVKDYYIQMCKNCRKTLLARQMEEVLNE